MTFCAQTCARKRRSSHPDNLQPNHSMRSHCFPPFGKGCAYFCFVLLGLTIACAFPPDLVFQKSVSPFDFRLWTMNAAFQESDQAFNPNNTGSDPWKIVGTGSVNGDRFHDLLFQLQTNPSGGANDGLIAAWYQQGANNIGAALFNPNAVGPDWKLVGSADFNLDGQQDLLWRGRDGGSANDLLAIWYMNGLTMVSATLTVPAATGGTPPWRLAGAADFNYDRYPDFVFEHPSTKELAIWYMNNHVRVAAFFASPSTSPAGYSLLSVADLNADTVPDFLFQDAAKNLWVRYNETNGVMRSEGPLSPASAGSYNLVAAGAFRFEASPDTDYDGRGDAQEILDGTLSNDAGSVMRARLGWFRFDSTNSAGQWLGEAGQKSFLAQNVSMVQGLDGQAARFTDVGAMIRYFDVETNGAQNLNLQRGGIRFFYKPEGWEAYPNGFGGFQGSGPGQIARLFEVGRYVTPGLPGPGWLALSIAADGRSLMLETQDGVGGQNTIAASFLFARGFRANEWSQISVSWDPTGIKMRQGGFVLNPTGFSGVWKYPPKPTRELGFTVGNSTMGGFPAKGSIDDLETFNNVSDQLDSEGLQLAQLNLLSAKALPSSSQIGLHFRQDNLAGGSLARTVKRRVPPSTSWMTLSTSHASVDYLDTVSSGTKYEYEIDGERILAGIDLPATASRGNVLILVDNTLAAGITNLNLLITNLVGDGWKVHVNANAPRHFDPITPTDWGQNPANIASVKASIVATNNALAGSGALKAIILLGHVAVPYSGFEAADGHVGAGGQVDNHKGAWPADVFYGDLDGVWTDTQPYSGTTAVRFNATTNYAGDGRFDQDFVPSNAQGIANIEIPVGRIDFANLDGQWLHSSYWTIAQNPQNLELLLINRYIAKTDFYRRAVTPYPNRLSITNNSTPNMGSTVSNCFSLASRFITDTSAAIFNNDPFYPLWFRSTLFGLMFGFGEPNIINNGFPPTSTSQSITDPNAVSPTAFFMLEGSWFGDWNLGGNFMRAALANETHGFISVWMRNQTWDMHGLGLGETFADCFLRTANLDGSSGVGAKRWLAIMGDPTLRAVVQNPPQNVSTNDSGLITWSAPVGSSGVAYSIFYSASGITGSFVLQTTTSGTSYQTGGSGLYMIRASTLVQTGSGSFSNPSQGVFVQRN